MTLVLRGRLCLLRAFRKDELDAVVAARESSDGAGGPSQRSSRTREVLRRRIETSGRVHNGWLEFAIETSDGHLVGDVQARRPPRSLPPGVWELGIELYGTASRGQGIGTEAVALITDYLFETEEAGRVQASTDLANAPMRAVLRKLGFVEEGVLRGFMPGPTDDEPRHDYVMLGVTAEEWVAARRSPTRR